MENGSALAIASVAVLATVGVVAKQLDPLDGLARGMDEREFDPRALAMGTQVQLQHTGDRTVASRIARDHLSQHPDYYEALAVMQKRLERRAG